MAKRRKKYIKSKYKVMKNNFKLDFTNQKCHTGNNYYKRNYLV